jgi:hypothetical protein
MPKPKKDDKYKKEQKETIDKLLKILDVGDTKSFVLYEVEHNKDKIDKINKLTGDIKKYFPCKNISGVKQPESLKRPWLSIIRQVLKTQYKVLSADYRVDKDNKKIRTRIYYLVDK